MQQCTHTAPGSKPSTRLPAGGVCVRTHACNERNAHTRGHTQAPSLYSLQPTVSHMCITPPYATQSQLHLQYQLPAYQDTTQLCFITPHHYLASQAATTTGRGYSSSCCYDRRHHQQTKPPNHYHHLTTTTRTSQQNTAKRARATTTPRRGGEGVRGGHTPTIPTQTKSHQHREPATTKHHATPRHPAPAVLQCALQSESKLLSATPQQGAAGGSSCACKGPKNQPIKRGGGAGTSRRKQQTAPTSCPTPTTHCT